MPRTIKVVNADDEPSYVVVEFREVTHRPLSESEQSHDGPVEFFLTNGDPVNHVAAGRFEDLDGESYYVQDKDDIEWLIKLD